MRKHLLTTRSTLGAAAALPGQALASVCATNPTLPSCDITRVPEIDALQGGAALAALAAIVLIVWERHRRAA